jgi:PAS domain S-box-containing protein
VAPTLPDTRGPFDPASLIHVVADAVIATDLTFHVTGWNHAAELIYGWSEAEALGQPVNDLLQTTYVVGERAAVLAALQAHGRWQGEVLQRTRSGQLIPILASVATVLAPDGTSLGIVTVNRDDRERQAAAAQLRAHAERLEVLTAASRAFAAVGADYHGLLDQIVMFTSKQLGATGIVRMLSDDQQWLDTVALYDQDPPRMNKPRIIMAIIRNMPNEPTPLME